MGRIVNLQRLQAAEVLSGALAKPMARLTSYMQGKKMRLPLVPQCEDAGVPGASGCVHSAAVCTDRRVHGTAVGPTWCGRLHPTRP
jgi:hypothetical protein